VERVSNSLPQVQRTRATTYSGWMSVFMPPPFGVQKAGPLDAAPSQAPL